MADPIRKESMTLPWITDRPPSETDAAFGRTVVVQTPGGWDTIDWRLVETGTPWLPYGPPKKPEPQVRRVPRGFDSLHVSVNEHGNQTYAAVADDKTAWVKAPFHANWTQVRPLPDREEVE